MIINKLGLYVRVVLKLVVMVFCYESCIMFNCNGQEVDVKSIMLVFMLVVSKGSEFKVQVFGKDVEDVLLDIELLINNCFDEVE